jgi:dipeptidyl aminopeptidase/acylaminoacyl peptidase
MNPIRVIACCLVLWFFRFAAQSAEPVRLDPVSAEQAEAEKKQLSAGQPRTLTDAMAEYRKTAEAIHYQSDGRRLPGYLYRPRGDGKHPAVLWNHGSEKDPRAQPELARFYTEHGFVFFAPVRHGHGNTEGPYIVDLQNAIREKESDLDMVRREQVKLHDVYNADVVAAVAWLKEQPFVDSQRIIVSGVSYGGIQTLLTAEKGLGVRGFISFAPGAMSFANVALRERMQLAAKNAKAPLLLLQAQNDYSTGPSEILAPILKAKGVPSHNSVYPAFGTTNQHGHGAFATWSLGTAQWGGEVLDFIEAAFKQP